MLFRSKFADDVPCFIVIREEEYNLTAALGSRVRNQDYRSIDIGIAAAQLVLRATDLGLSTCILGWFDEKKLQQLLDIRQRIRLVIALGYAKPEDPLRAKKRKEMDEMADFRA